MPPKRTSTSVAPARGVTARITNDIRTILRDELQRARAARRSVPTSRTVARGARRGFSSRSSSASSGASSRRSARSTTTSRAPPTSRFAARTAAPSGRGAAASGLIAGGFSPPTHPLSVYSALSAAPAPAPHQTTYQHSQPPAASIAHPHSTHHPSHLSQPFPAAEPGPVSAGDSARNPDYWISYVQAGADPIARLDTLVAEIRRAFHVDRLTTASVGRASADAALATIRSVLTSHSSAPAPTPTPPELVTAARTLYFSYVLVNQGEATAKAWLQQASSRPHDYGPFTTAFDSLPAHLRNPKRTDKKDGKDGGRKPWWKRRRERDQRRRNGGGDGKGDGGGSKGGGGGGGGGGGDKKQ